MKVTYEKSMEFKMLRRLEQLSNKVILRKDFSDLGSYRQISRGLKKLVEQKKLVRIGFGIYAKAYPSRYAEIPLIEKGFDVVSREALDRLGIAWELSSAESAYNKGFSMQVPMQNIVRLKSRFRRKIFYAQRQLIFEGEINAR